MDTTSYVLSHECKDSAKITHNFNILKEKNDNFRRFPEDINSNY